jgi:transcriptional regulator GlxA family with amidase domain
MASGVPEELSAVEQEIIAEIRALRASKKNVVHSGLLNDPARLLHHFILTNHGHVALRVGPVARELGVEMKTLQRTFISAYKKTPQQCQVDIRLAFAKLLLSTFPPMKISAIALMLGYKEVRDFNRFFRKHVHQRPSEWGSNERDGIERAVGVTSSGGKPPHS